MNELSIIIPCVSTIDHMPEFMDELAVYLESNPTDIDVIIVLNDQVKSLSRLVNHIRKKHPWLKFEILLRKGNPRNFGALARFGMAYSASRYVVFVSPYGEDDISLIMPMLNKIRQNCQVVQATRYASEADAKKVPANYRLYQSVYRFLTRIFLGYNISDSTYGYKMFDRIFMLALGLTQNGYSICPEITFKALLAGGKVEYLPSTMVSSRFNTDFKVSEEGLKYLYVLWRGFLHKIGILWF